MSETLSTDGLWGVEWNGKGLPEHGTLFYHYLENSPVGATIYMDLQPDADELIEEERRVCQFIINKVADDKWLRPKSAVYDEPCTTCELFDYLKRATDDNEIVVARGIDPRAVKKEMVDMGMVDAEMTFFAINESIDLSKDTTTRTFR